MLGRDDAASDARPMGGQTPRHTLRDPALLGGGAARVVLPTSRAFAQTADRRAFSRLSSATGNSHRGN